MSKGITLQPLGDGRFQLTHLDGDTEALLTVRGKDHDLTATELLMISADCNSIALRIFEGKMTQKEKDTMEWKQERGGLHRLFVDDKQVAEVEQGSETRDWYFTIAPHDEQQCGRFDTMAEAQARAEELLAQE